MDANKVNRVALGRRQTNESACSNVCNYSSKVFALRSAHWFQFSDFCHSTWFKFGWTSIPQSNNQMTSYEQYKNLSKTMRCVFRPYYYHYWTVIHFIPKLRVQPLRDQHISGLNYRFELARTNSYDMQSRFPSLCYYYYYCSFFQY